MPQPKDIKIWSDLSAHKVAMEDFSLRSALNTPNRFNEFSFSFENILFDFSKHIITAETTTLLLNLAKAMNVEVMRDAMFAGEKINNTEGRAVLHTALRAPQNTVVKMDGENVIPFVHSVLNQMKIFSEAVRNGVHTGYTNKKITDVVNIGIGGSDLGPRFVVDALSDFQSALKIHFVSNVDGFDMSSTLKNLNPETTVFIIASKTFTTEETMLNAKVARGWFLEKAPDEAIAKHFVALSTNREAVLKFGILENNMFPFRDWVGGRYSLWSSIGLSIALAIGFENFRSLLDGAYAMDEHFKTAPLNKNIPVIMGMLGVWYRNFWDYPAHLLLPYDTRLGKIAKFTQQMDMESNGKSVDRDGKAVKYSTGPIIFGEPGTDSQHSFMQFVHQSPTPIPADFIICKKPHHNLDDNHKSLMANFLAQTRALAIGQTLEEAKGDASRVFSGNRPTTSIILPELTPYTLGVLIAAYEHKVFVQGIIWNLNSFDQPGVELGKILAKPIRAQLDNFVAESNFDSSTNGLIKILTAKN
jgi:glucose-6-phosphate isomerase